MHIYVNFNLSGKCNKSDFATSQRGRERRRGEGGRKGEREIRSEEITYHNPVSRTRINRLSRAKILLCKLGK